MEENKFHISFTLSSVSSTSEGLAITHEIIKFLKEKDIKIAELFIRHSLLSGYIVNGDAS